MKVLSLFDGMSCGVIAMIECGVGIDRYVAYEIDKYAIQTSQHNFPFIEHKGDVFKADFTEFEGFDWLIGGSPCTYWSIAQTNNRETTASGMGWELFSQYVRALHEAKPKYFIYENNKSMSVAIKESIEDGCCVDKDKAYCLKHQAGNARDYFKKHHTQIKFEPVIIGYPRGKNEGGAKYEKAPTMTASSWQTNNHVTEPVRIPDYGTDKARPTNILGYNSTYGASGVAEQCPCFATPIEWDEEGRPTKARSCADGKIYTVYEVKDGRITINGKEYPIKLPDGFYIIRKLTVRECMRLQTIPEWYKFPVSDSQAYKMLGNGWTVAVISHLIDCVLK